MRLYRTQAGNTPNSLPRISWQGTQADAAAKRKALATEGCDEISTDTVDVPTDKPGLLAWLNANVVGE